MKKENVTGLIVYILLLIAAFVFGFLVLRSHYQSGDCIFALHNQWYFYMLFIFGALIAGVVIGAVTIELGHIIGARSGRYNIVSVTILGLCFYKLNNKQKVKFHNFDGLTGETKIVPKLNQSKTPNPSLFCILPTILVGLEIAVCIILFSTFSLNKINSEVSGQWLNEIGYYSLTVAVVITAIGLYNIIPLHLDSMNDGYRLRLCSGASNRENYNNVLIMENGNDHDIAIAEASKNIKKEILYSPNEDLNNVYKNLLEEKYIDSLKIIEEKILTNEKISNKMYYQSKNLAHFVNLYTLDDQALFEYAEKIPMSEVRSLSESSDLEGIRAYILLSGLYDKSISECDRAAKRAAKAFLRVPSNRQELEKNLYNKAIDKVINQHPKWDLQKYKL